MTPLACHRCSKSHNSPNAFLLTCRECARTWHHRCHTPPVEDQELIRRIYATTANNKAEDLSAWICRRCKKQQEERENGGTPASIGLDKDYTLASSDPGRTSRSVTATSSRFATPRKPRNYDNRIVQDAPAQASAPSWRPPPAAPRKASPRSRPQAPRQVIVHSGSEAPSPEALNQSADDDDDNDDLYGPPVERRLIRVFPTLAEELREQAAARENVTMEASLDPATSRIGRGPSGRKARKITARKLDSRAIEGHHPFYFSVDSWLQEHKLDIGHVPL